MSVIERIMAIAERTLVSIAVISALVMTSLTFPNHFAYATNVSGWFDMYIFRKPDFSATGSAIVEEGGIVTRLKGCCESYKSYKRKRGSGKAR